MQVDRSKAVDNNHMSLVCDTFPKSLQLALYTLRSCVWVQTDGVSHWCGEHCLPELVATLSFWTTVTNLIFPQLNPKIISWVYIKWYP